jgi:uncharacterized protein (TIGR03067 family)
MVRRVAALFFVVPFFPDLVVLAGNLAKDQKGLEGTWEVVELVDNGKSVPKDELKIAKIVFKADKMTLHWPNKRPRDFTCALDAKKKPKAIDLTALRGAHKGKVNPGIYQLEGDTLTLCLPSFPGEKGRPAKFKSAPGSELSLMILKRKNE